MPSMAFLTLEKASNSTLVAKTESRGSLSAVA
eukprot:CAMPEP_0179188420 /NCGR_PEP_ID=MMETSP0796-20121207/93515_1 /TAXON_ID=73915 /ORGANISM="Pyrodinium bahamense, Strain pbaha01" /LENGTH=31 /DNA_ID= /DNA_START= /DNA_END= /DNA_ORIENTATION=